MRQKDEELQRTVGCRTLDKNLVNSSRWRLARARAESIGIGFLKLKNPARIQQRDSYCCTAQVETKHGVMRQRASLGSGRIQHKSPRIIFNAIRGHIAYRRLRIGIFSSPNTCLPLNMLHEVALALAGLGLSTVGMTPSPSTLAPSPSESIHPRTAERGSTLRVCRTLKTTN